MKLRCCIFHYQYSLCNLFNQIHISDACHVLRPRPKVQYNTLCPFVYPAMHPLIPQFYGSTRCCVRSLCIDQKLFPERILIQPCCCGLILHPLVTVFHYLFCSFLCQSGYKIIFSHAVLPSDFYKKEHIVFILHALSF